VYKLAFSSNAFVNYTLEEAVNYLCYFGYDGIEILGDTPHITQKTTIDEISALFTKSNLVVSNINTNDCKEFESTFAIEPFLTSENREVFNLKLQQIKRNIEIAHALRCKNISISSGKIPLNFTKSKCLDVFFENLATILKIVPQDINVGIEMEPGHLIETLDDYKLIFKTFPYKNLGINLDIGHLYCVGNTIYEAFENFSSNIFHIHLEDIKDNVHYHLQLGDGTLPLKEILTFLAKNYDGFISIELYTYKDDPILAAYNSMLYFIFNSHGKNHI
jgi:fructoselysine 3-epimerase